MPTALRNIDCIQKGIAFPVKFAGENILLDPAGILFIPVFSALIVSDLHLEKGSSYARKGQFLPPYDTQATLLRLSILVEKYKPQIIISLGDSFHDDDASYRLNEDALKSIDTLAQDRDWIWITGNHDPSAPEHLPGRSASEIALGNIILRHIALKNETNFEISGHYHPCARIKVRGKRVRRACFACDEKRLIMPSFGVLTGGLNIADPAFFDLFHRTKLRAYMQGREQIYPIAATNIEGL